MKLHTGTDILNRRYLDEKNIYCDSDNDNGNNIIRMWKNKSERLNERELEIERKYGIEIEKVREEDLKVIDDYFAKLPDGFVKELKTYQDYEEYPDRKIYIYVSGDGVTDVKNDLSRGDYWILDNNKELKDN